VISDNSVTGDERAPGDDRTRGNDDRADHSPGPAARRVRDAYRRLAAVDRPEVWITLRPEADLAAEAAALDARLRAGADLPLAGTLLAVKDNVDVAGLPTTAGCPGFSYEPAASAPAVARLVAAGALVLGKTNMDQFATGLVGTRSPYGAVRAAGDPARVSGGSSSGSAVAVALGVADLGVGTDTAGSGRVPAAFNALVGVKPTLGLIPATGVVPAARPYDTVTVFARTLPEARAAFAVMAGPDPADPRSRAWPDAVRLAAPGRPRIALPRDADLAPLSPDARAAFDAAAKRLEAAGAVLATVDVSELLAAARLLYDGALVAERYAAVGAYVRSAAAGEAPGAPAGLDPVVARIVLDAAAIPAHELAADQARVAAHRTAARRLLDGFDALLLPTTTDHPTLAEVRADPVGVNRRLGTYTNFVNLLDLAAVAVPAGEADGGPFGVTVVAREFEDQVALDVAALLTGDEPGEPVPAVGVPLAVFGAHLRGLPLNGQLVALGARYAGEVSTAPAYRLADLGTVPAKPGLIRVRPDDPRGGAAVHGERWLLPPAALGHLLATLPPPMLLGPVELSDHTWIPGFHADPAAVSTGTDITAYGSWRAYLAATTAPR
jgi:allophanate hydrolase